MLDSAVSHALTKRYIVDLLMQSYKSNIKIGTQFMQGKLPHVLIQRNVRRCLLNCTHSRLVQVFKFTSFGSLYLPIFTIRSSLYFWTRVDPASGEMFNELKDPNATKLGICCINKGY